MLRKVAAALGILLLALAPAAQAQVKLEHKYVEGSKGKTLTTSKTNQVLSLNGMDIKTEVEETVTSSSSVGKRRDDGTVPIDEKVEAIRMLLRVNDQQYIDFDSVNPPAKKDEGPVAFVVDLLKAISGSSYTVVLDKKNQLVTIEGTQALLDKANDLDPMAAKALRQRLDQDRLKRSFEQSHALFPSILVRKGDTWDRTEEFDAGSGQTLTFEKRYEYLGPVEKDGKKLDKIGVKATSIKYAIDPNGDTPLKLESSDLKIDSSDGTILFDREAGHAIETTGITRIKGDLTLKINEMSFPSKLDLTLDISTKRLE